MYKLFRPLAETQRGQTLSLQENVPVERAPDRSRNKLVTFRLSPEEYEAVRRYCASSGERSLSDFVRVTVLNRIATPQRSFVSGDLVTLASALGSLDVELKNLRGRISAVLGPVDKDGAA